MLRICEGCHTPRLARHALEDADAIKREADRLVGEAVKIMRGLHADGLLVELLDFIHDGRLGSLEVKPVA